MPYDEACVRYEWLPEGEDGPVAQRRHYVPRGRGASTWCGLDTKMMDRFLSPPATYDTCATCKEAREVDEVTDALHDLAHRRDT